MPSDGYQRLRLVKHLKGPAKILWSAPSHGESSGLWGEIMARLQPGECAVPHSWRLFTCVVSKYRYLLVSPFVQKAANGGRPIRHSSWPSTLPVLGLTMCERAQAWQVTAS